MEQFESKVKYIKELNDGTFKTVTEVYLLANCESYTEAESLIKKLVFSHARGEKTILSIVKRKYQYVLHDENAEDWYKCVSALTSVDPDTDKESVVKNNYLVQADSVDLAHARLLSFMGDSVEDLDNLDISGIVRVNVTKVMEDKIADFEDEESEEEEMDPEMEMDLEEEVEQE